MNKTIKYILNFVGFSELTEKAERKENLSIIEKYRNWLTFFNEKIVKSRFTMRWVLSEMGARNGGYNIAILDRFHFDLSGNGHITDGILGVFKAQDETITNFDYLSVDLSKDGKNKGSIKIMNAYFGEIVEGPWWKELERLLPIWDKKADEIISKRKKEIADEKERLRLEAVAKFEE